MVLALRGFVEKKADQRAKGDADEVNPDVLDLRTAGGQELKAFIQKCRRKGGEGAAQKFAAEAEHQQRR